MKHLALTFILLMVGLSNLQAQDKNGQTVTIEITGIKKMEGNVLVALYNSEDTFLKKPYKVAMAKATGDKVEVKIEGVDKGTYAFSLFHDINMNKKLDKGMFGIPSEPYAFSNNASGFMGPATFADSSFKVDNQNFKQSVKLN